jgi:hypothetical protein
MRLLFACAECMKSMDVNGPPDAFFLPVNDEALYRTTCAAGHTALCILQQMRFEVLAETAVQALVDDYRRDAVSSFAASLERFYEFYVRAVAITKGVSDAGFDEAWKLAGNLSERQFGMYVATYMIENSSEAPHLRSRMVKFRNKVTHQGHIPTEREAIEFGQSVIDIVEDVLEGMRPKYDKAMQTILMKHFQSGRAGIRKDEANVAVSTSCHPMIYRMTVTGEKRKDLQKEIERRRAGRKADK